MVNKKIADILWHQEDKYYGAIIRARFIYSDGSLETKFFTLSELSEFFIKGKYGINPTHSVFPY